MGSKVTTRPLRAPGRIIINPDIVGGMLSGTPEDLFGGVDIGYVSQAVVAMAGASRNVVYESLGEVGDVLEADNNYLFSAFLRGWDDDAVRLLLAAGYEKGDRTGRAVFHAPGNRTPGQSAIDRSVRLLYLPNNSTHAPAVLVYRGIPDWNEGAEVAMNRRDELGIPLLVQCLRDSGDDILRIGMVEDL